MERCARCDVDEKDVRLFDAIYGGRMANICERCAVIENIPIIKKPDSNQLKESEQAVGVYDRMKRMSGVIPEKKQETFFVEDKLKELDEHPELELPERKKLNLVDHFNWHIMKERRRKGLTQKRLAESLGESEIVINMIEKGKFPENAEILIKKLEQFFQVRLRKMTEMEMILKEKQKEPVLLDEKGMELESIPEKEFEILKEEAAEELEIEEDMGGGIFRGEESPAKEPEIHCKVEVKKDSETPLLDDESVVECRIDKPVLERKPVVEKYAQELDMKQINPNAVTIEDLREIHKRRVDATRQEKLEEQRKIEERQGLIEARKEELRLMKERESRELDKVLGGTELLTGDKNEIIDEFEEELI